MGILRVSSSFHFEKKIKSFCQPPRYELRTLEDDVALVVVRPHTSEKIDEHILVIRDIDDIVQFNMPSHIMPPPDQRVPHHLSTALLQLNSGSLMGFWSLERTDNEDVAFLFSYSSNASKILLNKKLFDEIVADMLESCHELYQILDEVERPSEGNEPKLPGENSEHQQ